MWPTLCRGDGLIWVHPSKIVWFLRNIFLVRKNIGKLQKLEGVIGTMASTIYILLKTKFLAYIKWVWHKSHYVRRVKVVPISDHSP
jgi:hypothetical protein